MYSLLYYLYLRDASLVSYFVLLLRQKNLHRMSPLLINSISSILLHIKMQYSCWKIANVVTLFFNSIFQNSQIIGYLNLSMNHVVYFSVLKVIFSIDNVVQYLTFKLIVYRVLRWQIQLASTYSKAWLELIHEWTLSLHIYYQ